MTEEQTADLARSIVVEVTERMMASMVSTLADRVADEVMRRLEGGSERPALATFDHGSDTAPTVLKVGPITVDTKRHEVSVAERIVPLRPREFALLEALMRNSGMALTREQLLEQAWPYDAAAMSTIDNERTVDVHVRRLRIGLGDERTRLETVPGIGYKLNDR